MGSQTDERDSNECADPPGRQTIDKAAKLSTGNFHLAFLT